MDKDEAYLSVFAYIQIVMDTLSLSASEQAYIAHIDAQVVAILQKGASSRSVLFYLSNEWSTIRTLVHKTPEKQLNLYVTVYEHFGKLVQWLDR